MKQRGRPSAAETSIVQLPGTRALPPPDMPADQQQVWRQVIATKPASWFSADALPILALFCRHVATGALVQRRIETLTGDSLGELDKWLAVRDRESKITLRLATSLRLTPHSRIKAETAATQHDNQGGSDKPWTAAAD